MSNLINSKIFKLTFFSLLLAEVLSFLGWKFSAINNICFWVLVILVLILSLKKIEYGFYFIFAELFVGSFGYIFSFNFGGTKISLRVMLFLIVMAVFLLNVILRRSGNDDEGSRKNNKNTEITTPADCCRPPLLQKEGMAATIIFAAILLLSFFHGLLRGHGFANTFLDFNNWLYFLLLLPVLSVVKLKKSEFINTLISILAAAALFLSLKTLFLFYIFSHADGGLWTTVYKFTRDTLSGEVTHVSGNIWRVFLQSQVYLLISFFIFLCHPRESGDLAEYKTPDSRLRGNDIWHYFFLSLILTALITSFSRSFWVGLGAGIFVYLIILLIKAAGNKILVFVRDFAKILGVVVLAVLIVFLTLILPPKRDENAFLSAFQGRFGLEAAASSRINQIKPLTREIFKSPFIGFGFGKSITYQSNDPRIIPTTAGDSGEITTYAFEWGYLDMVLKFGLVGMATYLFIIFKILKRLINIKTQITNYGLQFGFTIALVAVLAVNIFSPYLNHPLGIGFIILYLAISN